MNTPSFQIVVDDTVVSRMFDKLPAAVVTRIGRLVEGAAIDVQRQMRILAPVAVTGQLRRSITYRYSPATLSAVIEPSVDYAADVEKGTRAHYVSAAPGSSLRAWAQQKGLDPYAVQGIIALRGTRKHPFVAPTFEMMKPKVESDIAAGIADVITESGNGNR